MDGLWIMFEKIKITTWFAILVIFKISVSTVFVIALKAIEAESHTSAIWFEYAQQIPRILKYNRHIIHETEN